MNRLRAFASQPNGALIGLALSLLIPSTVVFQRYLGVPGVVIYVAIASLLLFLGFKHRFRIVRRMAKVTDTQVRWLTALTFLIILAAFVVLYPIANSGTIGGGSDGDEALNLATTELLQGHYPYYPVTYLGNRISPLPGALFLAIPFVLLGNSAYQNFFWLLVFMVVMRSYFRDGRVSLLLLWAIFLLSPVIPYEFVIGSDYISNSLYVLLFMLWMVNAVSRPDLGSWPKIIPAVLLGIGLSSRANFVLILPVIFSALVQAAGWRSALKYTTITGIAFVMITAPFYLYDPQGFSPLHVTGKLGVLESVLPFASFIIPVATGLISLALAFFQPQSRNITILLRNCAAVLAFPVLCGVVLASIKQGGIDLGFAVFGTFFLPFGAIAFWSKLVGNPELQMN